MTGRSSGLSWRSECSVQGDDGWNNGDGVHIYGTSPVLADSDVDTMKDGDEVRAGTDPNSRDDVFSITDVDTETGLTLVHWSAKSNKIYQVVKSWELFAQDAVTGKTSETTWPGFFYGHCGGRCPRSPTSLAQSRQRDFGHAIFGLRGATFQRMITP